MERVLNKLDALDARLDNVDKTLAKQEVHLAEHIRRTALLEDAIVPIKKHVNHVEGALKFLGVVGLVASVATAIVKLVQLLT